MQSLYQLESMEQEFADVEEKSKKGLTILEEKLQQAGELFKVALLYMAKVAQFSEVDARQRSNKYLPTAEDLNVNTRIAGNTFLWHLLDNESFAEGIKQDKLEGRIQDDMVKKLYHSLTQKDIYQKYTEGTKREHASEKEIMKHIWRVEMLQDEDFQEYMNDNFDGWEDDEEMLLMLVEQFFKNPTQINFLQFVSQEKKEYARDLLRSVIEKDALFLSYIEPKLTNWDTDRVATIDMILLKMGVCEFLFFPTIPTKVTINEYIEIARAYSTPQSTQFVNGVLDNVVKELMLANKIRKIERQK